MYRPNVCVAVVVSLVLVSFDCREAKSDECLPAFKGQCRKSYSNTSPSMMPTLFEGEHFEGDVDWYVTHRPELGDVAVFILPTDNKSVYLKRVVGLPGDRVQITGGVLYINGSPVSKRRVEDYVGFSASGDKGIAIPQYEETLPNGVTYRVLEDEENGSADNTDEYVVPENHYFFLGDNRDNSQDSRYLSLVGYVPRENIVVKARSVSFSWNFFRIGTEIK